MAPSPQKNRAGTAACSASGAGRAAGPPARRPARVSPRQPPLGQRLLDRQHRRWGRAPAPAPAGGTLSHARREVRLKGQLLEGLGAPSPRASSVVAGKPWPPRSILFLPAWWILSFKGKFPSVPGFTGYSDFFFFFFLVGGGTSIMASARRTSACFRLAAIWVGGGDIKARVGLRCKVKPLPRRAPLQQPEEEGGRARQDGGFSGVFIH